MFIGIFVCEAFCDVNQQLVIESKLKQFFNVDFFPQHLHMGTDTLKI